MEFNEKLKRACKETGLNLKQISDLSGIAYSSVKKYASGQRVPKIEQIKRIANIPQLSDYKSLLLEIPNEFSHLENLDYQESEPLSPREAEFLRLMRELEALGKGADAIAILNAIAERK